MIFFSLSEGIFGKGIFPQASSASLRKIRILHVVDEAIESFRIVFHTPKNTFNSPPPKASLGTHNLSHSPEGGGKQGGKKKRLVTRTHADKVERY